MCSIPLSSMTGKAETLFSANMWKAVISGVWGDICKNKTDMLKTTNSHISQSGKYLLQWCYLFRDKKQIGDGKK